LLSCVLDHAMDYGEMPSVLVRRFTQDNPAFKVIIKDDRLPTATKETGMVFVHAELRYESQGQQALLRTFQADGWDKSSCKENVCEEIYRYIIEKDEIQDLLVHLPADGQGHDDDGDDDD